MCSGDRAVHGGQQCLWRHQQPRGCVISAPLHSVRRALRVGSNNVFNGASVTDFAPTAPTQSSGITPGQAAAFALEQIHRRNHGVPSSGLFTFTSNWAAQPITSMMEGGNTFENLMLAGERARDIAPFYGRTIHILAVVFVQGETWSPSWEDDFRTVQARLVARAQAITGQPDAPQFILFQTGDSDLSSGRSLTIQTQYLVGREWFSQGTATIALPMYINPYVDTVHPGPIGIMMRGQTLALALEAALRGEVREPLWPVLGKPPITWEGNTAYIEFNRELAIDPGAGNGGWIKSLDNLGFCYFGNDSAAISISNARVARGKFIAIDFNQRPTASNRVIGYARGVASEVGTEMDGWAGGRGQVISPTGVASPYAAYGLPSMINDYAIAFEEPLP